MIGHWRDLSNRLKPSFFADWECRRFHVEILDRRVSCVSLSSSCLVGFLQHASCPGSCCFAAASSWTCRRGQFGLCLLFQERNMMILNFSTKKNASNHSMLKKPILLFHGFVIPPWRSTQPLGRIPWKNSWFFSSIKHIQAYICRIMVPTKHL